MDQLSIGRISKAMLAFWERLPDGFGLSVIAHRVQPLLTLTSGVEAGFQFDNTNGHGMMLEFDNAI
jgi:hypothetical protein